MLLILFALLVVYLLVHITILVHELGHVLAGAWQGVIPDQVVVGMGPAWRLSLFGINFEFGIVAGLGGVRYSDFNDFTPPVQALIAAGGPVASFLAGAGFYLMSFAVDGTFSVLCEVAASMSVMIALINIIPITPLDGWRVLVALLSQSGIQVSQSTEKRIHTIGWFFIMTFAVVMVAVFPPA